MRAPPRLLVVEDDDEMRSLLEEELGAAGYEVLAAAGATEALERLEREPVDVVVTDLMMPGMKGDELLARIRTREPELPVVIITAFGSVDSAVQAIRSGAYHYITKPFQMAQLTAIVEAALQESTLRAEVLSLQASPGEDERAIVADSPSMRRTLDLAARAASSDAPVLVLGESGTGKELLARAIHRQSPRSERPFVAVNCSAIPETLLEGQLFGHRRGAFTDAREDRKGLLQEADGGTVLLDEIGDMPTPLQGKLLRVLQEREVHPLGAPAPVRVDIRIVASTHRNLEALVEEGRFRQDLFYRLNVIAIRIPPLRNRPEDILPLVTHFLGKHGARLGRPACTPTPEVLEILRRHPWPGNIRELENVIERALVLGRGDRIVPGDLPDALRPGAAPAGAPADPRRLEEVEREHILRTLRAVKGNKTAAARILGLDRKTLYRKLEQYGIRYP